MEILSKLFGSEARVKIIRLFLFNSEEIFDTAMIASKSKVPLHIVRKEIRILESAELIKGKSFIKTSQKKRGKKLIEIKKKSIGYQLNKGFHHLDGLKQLLTDTKVLEKQNLIKKLSKVGVLKLIIVSGVFTQDENSRLDMLVVGNNINKNTLNNVVKSIEAELGKELVYAYFETPDFQYRMGMYDKLLRDVMDYPHLVLLDKLV